MSEFLRNWLREPIEDMEQVSAERRKELDSDEGRRGVEGHANDEGTGQESVHVSVCLGRTCADDNWRIGTSDFAREIIQAGIKPGRLSSSESELYAPRRNGPAFRALGFFLAWVSVIAGLWWLSSQPANVLEAFVRVVAALLLIFGSIVIGVALAKMEKRDG